MKDLVSVEWLAKNLNREDIVILDCSVEMVTDDSGKTSYRSGQFLYESGHVPFARHADLIGALSDSDSAMLCATPEPKEFRNKIAALGVGDNTTVVLYDRSFTAWAARLWWMLRWIGFDNAVILNGGLDAWISENHELSTQPIVCRPAVLSLATRPAVVAGKDSILASVDDGSVRLIDTLGPDSFNGVVCPYGRAGHIPGATNAFSLDMFDESGKFLAPDLLGKMFVDNKDVPTITYCGAGILASATAFVLVQLGREDVSVYFASLQEWAADPTNPMVTAS